MCDCKNSYGWTQSHATCWADSIFMSLLIPPLTRYYFIKYLKKKKLFVHDFFPCKQHISHYEKDYLIKKIWGREFSILKGSATYYRIEEILRYINVNNIIIEHYFLKHYKPVGNMFCLTSEFISYMPIEIKKFVIQSIILFLKKHVTCIIRCDDNKWYFFDNERAVRKKKLKLLRIRTKNDEFIIKNKALLYIYLYAKKIPNSK